MPKLKRQAGEYEWRGGMQSFSPFFRCSPAIRHHFVVNQPPVMTDTSVGHGSKLNWRSEVTLHGSRAPKLDTYLAVGSL